jgi:hypothetical protein
MLVRATENLEDERRSITRVMSHTGYNTSRVVCAIGGNIAGGLVVTREATYTPGHLQTIFGIENLGHGGAFPRSAHE